jgi:hypothetical protein
MANIEAGAFHRRNFVSGASEAKTIDATVGGIALSGGTYGTRRYAIITVEVAELRFTVDGTSPTSTVGHVASAPDVIELESNEEIAAFRAIRTGATSAKIYATYKELKLTS